MVNEHIHIRNAKWMRLQICGAELADIQTIRLAVSYRSDRDNGKRKVEGCRKRCSLTDDP